MNTPLTDEAYGAHPVLDTDTGNRAVRKVDCETIEAQLTADRDALRARVGVMRYALEAAQDVVTLWLNNEGHISCNFLTGSRALQKLADALAADAGRLVAESPWQPIESAPHETTVLLYCGKLDDKRIETGFASQGWRNGSVSTMSWHGYATHWMPLPAAPTGAES